MTTFKEITATQIFSRIPLLLHWTMQSYCKLIFFLNHEFYFLKMRSVIWMQKRNIFFFALLVSGVYDKVFYQVSFWAHEIFALWISAASDKIKRSVKNMKERGKISRCGDSITIDGHWFNDITKIRALLPIFQIYICDNSCLGFLCEKKKSKIRNFCKSKINIKEKLVELKRFVPKLLSSLLLVCVELDAKNSRPHGLAWHSWQFSRVVLELSFNALSQHYIAIQSGE